MSKGYPSKTRTRKAFWKGAVAARREQARNPYANDVLAELWARGRAAALGNTALVIPSKYRPKAASPGAARPGQRGDRRDRPNPRDRGGRGGSTGGGGGGWGGGGGGGGGGWGGGGGGRGGSSGGGGRGRW